MKKIFTLLCCTLALAATSISCDNKGSDDKFVKLSASVEELNFGPNAETKTVDIYTSENWSVEVGRYGQAWFSVDPMSGKGNATLKVKVSDEEFGIYSSYFIVSTDTESVTVIVNQN